MRRGFDVTPDIAQDGMTLPSTDPASPTTQVDWRKTTTFQAVAGSGRHRVVTASRKAHHRSSSPERIRHRTPAGKSVTLATGAQ